MNRPTSLAIAILVVFSALATWAPPAAAQDAATFAVRGRVVSDAGEPVEGAYVTGFAGSRTASSYDKAVTGPDGAFRLNLTAGEGQVEVHHPQWNAYVSQPITVTGDVDGLTFTLKAPPPKTAIVEGRVLDASGQPVEGARVRIEQACCYLYDTRSSVAPTPAPTPSTTTAPPPSDPPAEEGNVSSASGASGGGSTGASPGMTRPIAPPCCYDGGETVTTGPDGAFRFATYGGPRQLYAEAKGYAQTVVQVDAKDGATVTQDIRLEKVPDDDATLKGRVLDARTGKPVANAQVSVHNLEWGRYEHATTDATGAYSVTTLPGWTQVSVHVYHYAFGEPMPVDAVAPGAEGVSADAPVSSKIAPIPPPGGPQYYPLVQSFRLDSGEATRDFRVEPRPEPSVVLQGYVVDPEAKKGVAGAHVSVWNQDTGDWGNAVTDANGSYRIAVRPGHYTANAWAEGHLQGGVTFVIAEGETLKRVDIETPAGQTRYAPCDECYAVAEPGIAYASGPSGGGAGEADGARKLESATNGMDAAAPPAAPAATGGAQRGAAYQGSGGGLPAYDAASAPEPGATTTEEGTVPGATQPVPGVGLLAALAVLGVAALALARRPRRG